MRLKPETRSKLLRGIEPFAQAAKAGAAVDAACGIVTRRVLKILRRERARLSALRGRLEDGHPDRQLLGARRQALLDAIALVKDAAGIPGDDE